MITPFDMFQMGVVTLIGVGIVVDVCLLICGWRFSVPGVLVESAVSDLLVVFMFCLSPLVILLLWYLCFVVLSGGGYWK